MQKRIRRLPKRFANCERLIRTLRWELEYEKCSKTFRKIFSRQNMQNETITKHFRNAEDIFKSAKNFLEKRNLKEDSSKTIIS